MSERDGDKDGITERREACGHPVRVCALALQSVIAFFSSMFASSYSSAYNFFCELYYKIVSFRWYYEYSSK